MNSIVNELKLGGGAARLEVLNENGQIISSQAINNKTTKAGVEYLCSEIFSHLVNPNQTGVFRGDQFLIGLYDIDNERIGSIRNTNELTGSQFVGEGITKTTLLEVNNKKYQYRYKTAVFPFGSIVGKIKSVSLHSSSTSSRLTIAELPTEIQVTNTQQLRVTYYRFFDITDYLTNNNDIKEIELTGTPPGATVTFNPFSIGVFTPNPITLAFSRGWSSSNGYMSITPWNSNSKLPTFNYHTKTPTVRAYWEDDIYFRQLELDIRMTPSFNNHQDVAITRLEIKGFGNYQEGNQINIYFDEPITKTGNEVLDFSITLSVACTNDQSFSEEEMDDLLDAIHG